MKTEVHVIKAFKIITLDKYILREWEFHTNEKKHTPLQLKNKCSSTYPRCLCAFLRVYTLRVRASYGQIYGVLFSKIL